MVVLVSHILHFLSIHTEIVLIISHIPQFGSSLIFLNYFITLSLCIVHIFHFRGIVGFNMNLSILNSHLKMHTLKLRLNIKQLT